jgi:hypothetical protein
MMKTLMTMMTRRRRHPPDSFLGLNTASLHLGCLMMTLMTRRRYRHTPDSFFGLITASIDLGYY